MHRFFGVGGDGGYRANAVQFDGSNDYLTRGAELTGITDGQAGTISAWINLTGGNATDMVWLASGITSTRFVASRLSSNVFQIFARRADATEILKLVTVATYTSASGWIHFLSSWDLGTAGRRRIYVNDAADLSVATFTQGETIDYVADAAWSMGAHSGGTLKFNSDVADLWFDDSWLDISAEANRRKFITPNGKPVDLGEAGQLPTGSSPLVFLASPTASWQTNLGTGGGFTENGALTDGSSSPSD